MPDKNLIALSNELEARSLTDLWHAAPMHIRQQAGFEVHKQGPAIISASTKENITLVNRTLGIDAAEPSCAISLANQAIETYERLGIERYFLHVAQDAPEALKAHLQRRGLTRGRAWMKFKRDASPVTPPKTSLTVREARPADKTAFSRIYRTCYNTGEAFTQIAAGCTNLNGWHTMMAFEDDVPVGSTTLVFGGISGLLCMGITDPGFRCRGVQGALAAACINKAAELGLKTLFTETGVAVAGEPQHSYGNIQRYGFKEWYKRDNYTVAPKTYRAGTRQQ